MTNIRDVGGLGLGKNKTPFLPERRNNQNSIYCFRYNQSMAEVRCNLNKEQTKTQLSSSLNEFFTSEENSAERESALCDIRYSFYSIRNGRHRATHAIDTERAESFIRYFILTIKKYIDKEETITTYVEENDLKLGEAWDILSMLLNSSLNGLANELLANLETRDLELAQLALNLAVLHLSSRKFLLKGWTQSENYCLRFLNQFNQLSGPRQLIMGKTPDLVRNIIGVVKLWIAAGHNSDSRAIDKVDIPIVTLSMSCLIHLLGRCLETDLHNARTILCNGGFMVVEKGFLLALKLLKRNIRCEEKGENNRLLSRTKCVTVKCGGHARSE